MTQEKKQPRKKAASPRKKTAESPNKKEAESASEKEATPTKEEQKSVYSEKTVQVAELAVKIMGLYPRNGSEAGRVHHSFDDSYWDDDFEAAKLRAQMVLDEIENDRVNVDAYQLFEEGTLYSNEQLGDRFKNAGWEALGSTGSAKKLVQAILKNIEDYNSELTQLLPENADQVREDTLAGLEELALREGVREVFPAFAQKLNHFVSSLHGQSVGLTESEAFGEGFWLEKFRNWCFEKKLKGNDEVKRCRAHELFRFARERGWKTESLVRSKEEVEGDYFPKLPPSRLRRYDLFETNLEKG